MEEPVFATDLEALNYYRTLARSLQSDLDDTKLALDEFQASSKELETELEKELQATEKQLKDLRGREENLLHEIDQWKTKYHASLKDHTKTMSHMQTELESCRKSNEEYRTRLRDMELDNDELEGKERMVTSSLQDVETKYGKAIERITLLEDEVIGKSKLEEEHQRLKDDFRDMSEELAILREHMGNSTIQTSTAPGSRAELTTLQTSSSPSSSPVTVPASSEIEFGSPGVIETLKDAEEMPSPLRTMMRTKPAPSMITQPSQDSPRRRLASLGPNAELSSSRSPSSRALASSQIRKSGSLRVNLSSGSSAKKSLQNVFTLEPSLGASTNQHKSSTRNSYPRNQISPLSNQITNNSSSTASTRGAQSKGSSHIQSLRAETQRMQGMTKKLVGSRVLRTGSAIPVPKTFASSHLVGSSPSAHHLSKSSLIVTSTLNQSQMKSPKRNHTIHNPSGAATGARHSLTQPAPSQDLDPDSSFIPVPAGVTALPRARIMRPASRLSTGSSDHHHHLTGIPTVVTTLNSSINSTHSNTLLPRRKASVDLTVDLQRPSRPASIQDGFREHIRRQSVGFVQNLSEPDLPPKPSRSRQHNLLGKSLNTPLHSSSRLFPVKKS